MTWQDCNFITLRDVYVAYRKAKRDAFFDPNSAHGLKFVAYEENLTENLEALLTRVKSGTWAVDLSFIGTYRYIPKSIEPFKSDDDGIVHFCATEPLEDWKRIHGESNKSTADFRLVIDATVDYMIVSVLWILKVGHKYDERLDSRFAVGNRLRRLKPPEDAPAGTVGKVNELSHSLFAPYFTAYGGWRQRGLETMKSELEKDHHIVAVTMDLKRFYHYIDPSFLLHPKYLQKIELTLSKDERVFTEQLLQSIVAWRNSSEDESSELGVPVGLTASSVIANVLLNEFDSLIRKNLMPVYYGRYVDDVFLVLRPGETFSHGIDFLKWLAKRLSPEMKYIGNDTDPELTLKFSYAGKSKLTFVGKKQKIFELRGKTGLDLIHPIMEQIRRQSSEHRLLPELPEDESGMAIKALLVTPDATLEADALRKADVVTLRRAGFALLLSEIESHARDLEPKCWQQRRREFYGLAERHLMTPKGLFDYFKYIPRIIGLMVASKDWDEAESFIKRLPVVIDLLKKTTISENGSSEKCWVNLNRRIQEAILSACPSVAKNFQIKKLLKTLHAAIINPEDELHNLIEPTELSNRLKMCDWGRTPYAQLWLNNKLPKDVDSPAAPETHLIARKYLRLHIIKRFMEQAQLSSLHWPALAFPTRPIGLALITNHMSVSTVNLRRNIRYLSSYAAAFRGAWIPASHGLKIEANQEGQKCPNSLKCPNGPSGAKCSKCPNEYRHILVPDSAHDKILVAVTNFETTDKQWLAAVRDDPDLSLVRYEKLQKLLNDIMKEKVRPGYIVLPECSLPRKWMMPIAHKLSVNRISLLAGLEYERTSEGVRNDALVSLTTDFAGYSTQFCITQPKLAPAWAEENHVREKLGIGIVKPEHLFRPIYVHKGFQFGLLLCSDLTDIRNRNHFQGWVDALFVLEWNQDVNTFSSLVESGALDLHSFVIQANNRQFGDSRIRGPYKEEHKRDIVRVKGGVHDYYVIGEIDYKTLRDFQSAASPDLSGKALFKPFPIGFDISPKRRVGKP